MQNDEIQIGNLVISILDSSHMLCACNNALFYFLGLHILLMIVLFYFLF